MLKVMRAIVQVVVVGALIGSLQAQVQPPARAGRAGAGRSGAQAPAVPSLSQRPPGSSLGTIRVGGSSDLWFQWRVGIPSTAVRQLTFSEAVAKADTLPVTGVVAIATQVVSPEIPKKLDFNLQTGERAAVVRRLREVAETIFAYRIDNLPADESSQRKVFEFAKAINAPMIITSGAPASFAVSDKLANEFEINVAVVASKDPKSVMSALEGRSKRMGIAADLGGWMQAGIKPVDGLAVVKDKLMVVEVRDRSALGAAGKDVLLGSGAADLPNFFFTAFMAGVKPLLLTIDASGTPGTYADLEKAATAFENAMTPAMAERVRQYLKTPPGQIRGGDRLTAQVRAEIDAAAPRQPVAKPKKPRKLLVTDLNMYSGHSAIPNGNYLIELMGKYTGAYEPVFSNDLELLKYPKIKEFDAVWLSNVCGMIHNDPDVRAGILRYVREGGGMGGHHAVTYANLTWPEFTIMMGGWAGAHHTENQVLKVEDTNSPLTKMFKDVNFDWRDEYYHFPTYSNYSRQRQHVLLTVDVQKSDLATSGRMCPECTRPDHDYALAWISNYGKGRTYFTPLGHPDNFYTSPMWAEHMLAAIQYVLGDVDANATPSAKLAAKK